MAYRARRRIPGGPGPIPLDAPATHSPRHRGSGACRRPPRAWFCHSIKRGSPSLLEHHFPHRPGSAGLPWVALTRRYFCRSDIQPVPHPGKGQDGKPLPRLLSTKALKRFRESNFILRRLRKCGSPPVSRGRYAPSHKSQVAPGKGIGIQANRGVHAPDPVLMPLIYPLIHHGPRRQTGFSPECSGKGQCAGC